LVKKEILLLLISLCFHPSFIFFLIFRILPRLLSDWYRGRFPRK
jgi:hypothetical protein